MICIEIKKGGQSYKFNLTGDMSLSNAYDQALKIATNKENFTDGNQIMDLGTSKDYEFIHVWEEAEEKQTSVAPPVSVATDKDYIKSFEDRIMWLGQDLRLKGIKAVEKGVPLILIYEINNEPAQVQISRDNLEGLTEYQGRVLGYDAPMSIIPPGDLYSEEEAREYIQDYIDELRKASPKEPAKDALAYFGFTKDEEQ
ncbi:hypothetical protein [Cytobacillus kochii]|uniref:hypothetical protein n=1 Tax=Cytobacillus kochii TaxID=859143 RepID=UPI00402A8A9D